MTLVTCKNCKWVSMGVSREYAENEVKEFNDWYDQQEEKEKLYYGGHSSLETYKCCENMDLREAKEGDCPTGSTLNPVIYGQGNDER